MKEKATIHFNKEAVKAMSKAQFVDNHEHHKEDIDLEKAYDEIVGSSDEAEKPKESKKK